MHLSLTVSTPALRRALALAAASTALAAAGLVPGSAFATEGGGTTAAAGAEGFLAGALPPPGSYGLVYANHYSASRVNDASGNSMIPGFKVSANALVGRVVWMSDTQVAGGSLGAYGVLPLVDLKVDAAGASDSRSALGDAEVGALVAWHAPEFHQAAALAVVLPTGAYDKTRLANTGSNLTTFRPVYVFSYLPASGLDVSAKFSYSINQKNSATDYQSGQYLHGDWNVGMAVAPQLQLGLQGYFIRQTTDDTVAGAAAYGDGFRTKVTAFGPAVRWQSATGLSLEARVLKETGARYHSEGTALWLKAVWKL